MMYDFKITDKHWSGVFIIMDKVIFEDNNFQDNGTRDSNLRVFLLELLTFNLEWYIQKVKPRRSQMNFRQQEALGILEMGNKWFIDNRYKHKLILDTFERVKIQIDDCILSVEDKWRRDSLYEDFDIIRKWFDFNDK